MKGRKPKPLVQHIAEGTFREERHAHLLASVGVIPTLSGPAPELLNERGREVWDDLLKALPPGHLTEAERPLVVIFCASASIALEALDHLNAEGLWSKRKSDSGGGRKGEESDVSNKWLRLYRDMLADVARLSTLLGLNAVDRSRVVRASAIPGAPAVLPTVRPLTALDRLYRGMRPADET